MDLKGQFRVILGQNGSKLTQNGQKRIIELREPNKTTIPINLNNQDLGSLTNNDKLFLNNPNACFCFSFRFSWITPVQPQQCSVLLLRPNCMGTVLGFLP